MTSRPFKVLGVQQIAIGGTDKLRLQRLWVDMFGLQVTGTFSSERENVNEDICTLGVGPFKVEVDLMQPLDAEKKPAVHQTPLNHIGLWIDDLPKAVEWLTANGVRFAPGGIRAAPRGSTSASFIPKATRSAVGRRGCSDRVGAGARRGDPGFPVIKSGTWHALKSPNPNREPLPCSCHSSGTAWEEHGERTGRYFGLALRRGRCGRRRQRLVALRQVALASAGNWMDSSFRQA